jgi:predicted ATPase/DNA-binding SARP family transcriptional activator
VNAYQAFLLGAPRLEHQGEAVKVDTRKALALLAYLLLTSEPHSRDSLAALLWPESGQASARAALRRTLSTLRGALDERLVDFGRETVALNPGSELWCDVTTFRDRLADCRDHGHSDEQVCPLCLSPLEEAVELYKDDFMAGFSLRDSPAFDDWQFLETDRLRRELASVLERLAVIYRDKGDFKTALEYARRWLRLDELNEAAHRALINLYALAGQRNAALRQYRNCVRILDQELGVPPLDETSQLYEAVKANRIGMPGNVETVVHSSAQVHPGTERHFDARELPSPMSDQFPLVGRAPEWEGLIRRYESIRQDGLFIALTGETGVGKTRLAQEFIMHLQSRGVHTLSTRCYVGESNLAYAPLIDLLRQGIHMAENRNWWQGLNQRHLGEASLLVPELSDIIPDLPPPQPADGPGAQSRFYEGVCQILEALVRDLSPGVLFVDNLEYADEASLELLAYLVRRLQGRPLLVLAAWQTTDATITTILEQMLNDTIRQDYGIHLSLAALSTAQAHELIDHVVENDQRFSREDVERLVEESQGLPYFLVEYLNAVIEGEIIPKMPAESWPVPETLRTMLKARLANLSGTARQILQAAAIIGRTFDFNLLQTTSGRTDEEIIQGIEELLARNLIREVPAQQTPYLSTARYDFRHDQFRALVLEDLSLVRRYLLHRRTAEALEEQARFKPVRSLSGQIAYHFQNAGVEEKAAEYYFQAGKMDRSLHANADALAHFQAALALGYTHKSEALVELGDLYKLQGDYDQALQQYEAAAAYSIRQRLPGIEQKIGQVHLRRGHWEQAACHFETALLDLDALAPELQSAFEAKIRADWSLACHRLMKADQAAALAHKALRLAEASGDPLALAQAHNLLAVLARAEGDPGLAFRHLEDSLAFARQLESPGAQIAALNNLSLAQADLGENQAAIETVQQALDECLILGDRHLEAALRNNYADLLRASGNIEAAMAQLKQAVAIFAEIGQQTEDWEPEIWKLAEW